MRRSGCFLVATALIAAFSLAAHADTISIFSLTNFTFTTGGSASGWVTIDTTTGISTGAHITFVLGSVDEHFIEVFSQGVTPESYFLSYGKSLNLFFIALPETSLTETSLIGYTGSVVCSFDTLSDDNCHRSVGYISGPSGENEFQSGALTFDSSTTTGVTPEPSTFTLLGTGLLAAVGAFRRKLFNA